MDYQLWFTRVLNIPPPKEGRYHTPRRQRSIAMFRLLFVTFALAIMCVIVMVLVLPSDSEGKTYNRNAASSNTRHAGYESTALKPWPVLEKTTTYPTLVKHGSYQTPPMALQEPEGQKISASTPQWFPGDPMPLPAADHSIESRRNTIGGRSTFEESLSRVFSLLPDEIHVRELLRPIEGTGKEKLRETGVRVRAFKTFFEAWEALHLVAKDGIAYVRDDIVQYMRSHHDEASKLTLAQKIRSYEVYRHFLQLLSTMLFPWTAPYFADHMNLHAHFRNGGRGIVLSAGDDQAPFLLVSIPSFRRLGCTLPIEVMYLGDSDLSEDYRAELELLPGVITRDLSQMVSDEGWRLAGWASKPFAILLSSFREVIFIDADALFLRDPEILFQDPSYAQTGALFFKDRRIMPESKKRWLQQILPKPVSKQVMQSHFWTGTSGHMQESGVVVIDKWKHFVAMLLVTRMNGPDRDGNEEKGEIGVYDMVYGELILDCIHRTLPYTSNPMQPIICHLLN